MQNQLAGVPSRGLINATRPGQPPWKRITTHWQMDLVHRLSMWYQPGTTRLKYAKIFYLISSRPVSYMCPSSLLKLPAFQDHVEELLVVTIWNRVWVASVKPSVMVLLCKLKLAKQLPLQIADSAILCVRLLCPFSIKQ